MTIRNSILLALLVALLMGPLCANDAPIMYGWLQSLPAMPRFSWSLPRFAPIFTVVPHGALAVVFAESIPDQLPVVAVPDSASVVQAAAENLTEELPAPQVPNLGISYTNVCLIGLGTAFTVGALWYCKKYYHARQKNFEVGRAFAQYMIGQDFRYAAWRSDRSIDKENCWPEASDLLDTTKNKNLKDALLAESPETNNSNENLLAKKSVLVTKIKAEKKQLEALLTDLAPHTAVAKKIINSATMAAQTLEMKFATPAQRICDLATKYVMAKFNKNDSYNAWYAALDKTISYADPCSELYIRIYKVYIRLCALEHVVGKFN